MKPLLLLRFCLQDLAYDWRRSLLNLLKLTAMIATHLLVAVLGLGAGIIVSALTTRYRDLRFLVCLASSWRCMRRR